ncbi:tlde1 domain-containing protein [Mesorhizobium sp. ArgA1]
MTSKRSGKRWVVVPAVGAALALWSVATMAGLYSLGTSLTAASNSLPQSLLLPRTITLADSRRNLANSWAPRLSAQKLQASLLSQCDAGCAHSAASFAHDGKMARLKPATPAVAGVAIAPNTSIALATSRGMRFDGVVAKAKLSPQKLAAAFAKASNAPFMLARLPAAARFAEVRMPDQHGPASERFGPEVAEIERSSRLALALANTLPDQGADMLAPPPAVAAIVGAQDAEQAEVQVASLPPQDDLPDSIALPGRRPRAETAQPAEAPQASKPQASKLQDSKPKEAKPQADRAAETTAPQSPAIASPRSPRSSSEVAALPGVPGSETIRTKPGKRVKAQSGEMLAYAKPDVPGGGVGRAFKDLFATPGMGGGVAVYDISAKTVYMPDGSRLEAHSGLGSMVDQPRFVNKKNVGPTPPNTYDLKLRESRFHGVEAIRLTPVGGGNKYGRDGLLAHTYMLRGGRAESNGCVVFKDYARFLSAYKKGKIKRLVVVPRLSKPLTRVAQDGRGA